MHHAYTRWNTNGENLRGRFARVDCCRFLPAVLDCAEKEKEVFTKTINALEKQHTTQP